MIYQQYHAVYSSNIIKHVAVIKIFYKGNLVEIEGTGKPFNHATLTSSPIVDLAKTALQSPLTGLINLSVRTSIFPDSIKRTKVTPLLKKNGPMDNTNYRPVSILTVISKIYEKILSQQLNAFFENIFDKYLCT